MILETIRKWSDLDWLNHFQNISRLVFLDRIGILIFLGGIVYFGVFWRLGLFITDNITLANTFIALTEGHLYVDRTFYGPARVETPGYHIVDGRFYGRNYGQLFLSLPMFYVLRIVSTFADLSIAIAAAWSLAILAIFRGVGRTKTSQTGWFLIGSFGALLTFALNSVFAIPTNPLTIYLMAMQLTTIVLAGLLGVFVYRLLKAIHNRRVGVFIATATLLATPIAFWSSIPKRHVLVSLLAFISFYSFYASRFDESIDRNLSRRCIAYASVGLWAWVHAPEALVMFVVLVPFDLATARSNDWRQLGTITATFVGSLIPFFGTNYLISGNPVKPPRFLSRSTGDGGVVSPGGSGGFLVELTGQFSPILRPFSALIDLLLSGLIVFVTEPHRVLATFIRSGPAITRATPTDLTILETTPIFGVFVVVPFLLYVRWRSPESRLLSFSSPVRQTDAFALTFVVAFTLLYMSRLPLHAMWTVRYLLPIVPFGMYFVGRLGPVRRIVTDQGRLLAFSYASLVLIGGQLLVVYLIMLDPSLNEVMQFHALLGLAAASVSGLWAVTTVFDRSVDDRIGAVALSLPLAAGTLFVLLTGIEYYVVGHFALGMTEVLSEAIPLF